MERNLNPANSLEYSEWKQKCRLCLQKNDSVILYAIFHTDGQIAHKIQSLCSLLVQETDLLPQKICHKCIYDLDSAYKFQMKCLNSYAALLDEIKLYEPANNSDTYRQVINKEDQVQTNHDEANKVSHSSQLNKQITVKQEKQVTMNLIPMSGEYSSKNSTLSPEVYVLDDVSEDELEQNASSSEARYAKHDENVILKKTAKQPNIAAEVPLKANVENKITVSCDICNKFFDSHRTLSHHRLKHSNQNSKFCDFQTSNISSLSSHKKNNLGISQTTIKNEVYRNNVFNSSYISSRYKKIKQLCRKCGKTFVKGMSHLCDNKNVKYNVVTIKQENKGKKHVFKRRKINNTHTCNRCGRVCSSLDKYVQHYKMHTVARLFKYQCENCHNTFITQVSLEKHSCQNLNERAFIVKKSLRVKRSVRAISKCYSCNSCNETFWQSEIYAKHQKKHLKQDSSMKKVVKENNILKCNICQKSFLKKQGMATHLKMHKKNREMETRVGTKNVKMRDVPCNKKGKINKLTRKTCQKNITNKLIFEKKNCQTYCKKCKKEFKSVKGLNCHISRNICQTKQQEKSVSVIQVKEDTNSSTPIHQQLVYYKESHSEVSVQDKAAKNIFSSLTDTQIKKLPLVNHARKGALECDICSEIFTSNVKLERHKMSHVLVRSSDDPARVKCKICHKVLSSRSMYRHEALHQKERLLKTVKLKHGTKH